MNRINKRVSHGEIYFFSFWVKHIPKEIKKFIRKKNIITNIYKIQTYVSIVGRNFYIRFVDFVLRGLSLLACFIQIHFFYNDREKNDKIILEYY